jgi:phosphoribosylformylglycinamidine (FGAM) synthase-like enzyme
MTTSQLRAALAAGTAAIVTAAVLAASGSAQAPPTTLHLVSKTQKHVGFFPKGAPHQGSRLGFGGRISGDDTGVDRTVCTVIGKQLLCTSEVHLSKGTLSAQGLFSMRSHNHPSAITGGTGAYDGARGTAYVTDVDENTTNVTVALLP